MESEKTKVETTFASAISGIFIVFILSLILLLGNAALIFGAAFAFAWGATDSIANGFGLLNGTAGVAGLAYLLYRIFHLPGRIASKK